MKQLITNYHVNYRIFNHPDSTDLHFNYESLGEANINYEKTKKEMNPHDQLFLIQNSYKLFQDAKGQLEYKLLKNYIKFY